MDDTLIFNAFVQNVLGVAVVRARTELVSYIPTFRQLMQISEEEIDNFIKFIQPIRDVLPTNVLFTCRL